MFLSILFFFFFFREKKLGFKLPSPGDYATGIFFIDTDLNKVMIYFMESKRWCFECRLTEFELKHFILVENTLRGNNMCCKLIKCLLVSFCNQQSVTLWDSCKNYEMAIRRWL